jgi:hypothetical protein
MILGFSIVTVAIYLSSNLKEKLEPNDEYELIKKYLLNDNPLYGYNKPKIWIHTKYEYNSRVWSSFGSRTSRDLNLPYIHLTIKSILNHNGDDFNIILIDDNSFSKLIPHWDKGDLNKYTEPLKTRYRNIGLYELVYYYGGMVIPNTFICLKNLKPLYEETLLQEKPFVAECINRTCNILKKNNGKRFIPSDYILGSVKNCQIMKEYIDEIKNNNKIEYIVGENKYQEYKKSSMFIENEQEILGTNNQLCIKLINEGKMNVIDGSLIGIKDTNGNTILIEDLFEDKLLDLTQNCFGIYLDDEEILKRNKYNWFCNMNEQQILDTKIAITKYIKISMINGSNEYYKKNEIKTISAI